MGRLRTAMALAGAALAGCAPYFRATPILPMAEVTDTAFPIRWDSRGVSRLALDGIPVPGRGVRSIPFPAGSCVIEARFTGKGGGKGALPRTVGVARRPAAAGVDVALDSVPILRALPSGDSVTVPVPAGSQPLTTVTTTCASFCRFTPVSESGSAGRGNTVIVAGGQCRQGETVSIMRGDTRRYRITPLAADSTIAGAPLLVVLRQAGD